MRLYNWIKYRYKRWQLEHELKILLDLINFCWNAPELRQHYRMEFHQKFAAYRIFLRAAGAI